MNLRFPSVHGLVPSSTGNPTGLLMSSQLKLFVMLRQIMRRMNNANYAFRNCGNADVQFDVTSLQIQAQFEVI